MSKLPIYLDYAAATPIDERVRDTMEPYLSDKFYNPSATYLVAKSISKDLNEARANIARCLGVRSSEIIFTAGGTEANNLAIQGIMHIFPDANMIVSAIEHESVLSPASQFKSKAAPVDKQGIIDVQSLEKLINDHTVLVSVMYANNEVGSIQPISKIAQVIDDVRKKRRKTGNSLPIYLHTDACQAANYLDLHTARLGVDLMTLNGGKIYGPKQSGVLFIKSGTRISPLIFGGGQERGLRSGTENVAASIGFSLALNIAQENRYDEGKRMQALQQYFLEQLENKLPTVIVNGSLKKRLPNNVHITISETDNERLLIRLDEAGILAAAGSACSASSEEPSHVLRAMGVNDKAAQASLRFSMGRYTSKADIDKAVFNLVGIIESETNLGVNNV